MGRFRAAFFMPDNKLSNRKSADFYQKVANIKRLI